MCLTVLRKLECFKHAIVVGDVTPSVAHLRIRASAPSSLLSRFPVSVASANVVSQETFCRLRHVSVHLDCNSLHMCLLSASCHPAQSLFCWSCADSSTHLRWLKTSSWWKKTRLHGSGAGSLSTVHADLLIMEAQVGQLQAQLAQTQTELQYAIEQIRILTLQVNRNTSAVTPAATTHRADRDISRLSLTNAQGKPSVRQGHHSKHLRW